MALLDVFKRKPAARLRQPQALPPVHGVLHELFSQQARSTPGQNAIIDGNTELSYEQLDRRANQVAHFLLSSKNLNQETNSVGLLFRQSAEYVIAALGVLKAGYVVVPLDRRLRGDNMNQLLCDCNCGLILGDNEGIDRISRVSERTAFGLEPAAVESEKQPDIHVTPDDLAFIMHTSGTTGYPKSVPVRHAGLVNMARNQARTFGLLPKDRILLYSSIFYDASLAEIFSGLLAGAVLIAANEDSAATDRAFIDFLRHHQVTVVTLMPAKAARYTAKELDTLRVLIVAGSAAQYVDLQSFPGSMDVFNAYGLTETSVCVSCHQLDPNRDYGDALPIGRPLDNIEMLILGPDRKPAPTGEPGEICVSGVSLATGYLNKPGLTTDKFIPHPLQPGQTLFRTGDRGLVNQDGEFFFLGRIDQTGGSSMENNGEAASNKKARQKVILDHLAEEGYRPNIDDDNDIMFKNEGRTYYITLFEDDEQFHRLLKPDFWPIESDEEYHRAVSAAGVATGGIKVAKLFLTSNKSVFAVVESFCDTPEQFNTTFNRQLSALGSVIDEFVQEMRRTAEDET